jgi:peptidoglycan hydrolase-like protein with peptidoglycan-binding domain
MKSDMGKSGAMKSSRKAAGGARQEQVKAAQQALKDKGHDPGPIDGRMGPKTQTALREFQKAEGMKETGRLDQETMAKLGVPGSAAGASSETPSAASPSTGSSSGASGSSSAPSSSGSSSGGSSTGSTGSSSGSGGSSSGSSTK